MKPTEDLVLEFSQDTIDVTSNHRPDTSWSYTDNAGHLHKWYEGDNPAKKYKPLKKYHIPSIVWIKDRTEYYEDGSPYEVGHYGCLTCGAIVDPGYTPDIYEQRIPSGIIEIQGQCVVDSDRLLASKLKGAVHQNEGILLTDIIREIRTAVYPSAYPRVNVFPYKFQDNGKSVKVWFSGRMFKNAQRQHQISFRPSCLSSLQK